ncbi:minor tail protein [Gordonia phage Pleakley]|uniref:Minor tail protein n=1 Tax=Gordonia phage Pleakley TaxID=2283246 RepID=A0A345M6H0_9CAUD|nr:minor tail protein [Gordonia phage Pleakley]AXH66091.1 minor tail protein [Gordonia phage Pleakley]
MSDAIEHNRGTPEELLLAGKQLALKSDAWSDLSVEQIVQKILDLFGLDIPNWQEIIANFEDLRKAIEGTYVGSDAALNAIQAVIGTIRRLATGIINPSRLPLIPFSHIGEAYPNLLENGGFDGSDSLDGEGIWTWDSTEGHTAPGAAKAVADGTRKVLLSNSVPATPEQKFDFAGWVKWTGVTGGMASFRVSAVAFSGTAVVEEKVVANIDAPVANKTWTEMVGTYQVPTGADSVRVQVEIGATVTAGTVWWDDMKVSKYGTLPQRFVNGLIDALGDLGAGIVSVVTQIGNLFDKITGVVGATISDVQQWISQLKTILSGGTVGSGLLPTLSEALRSSLGNLQTFVQDLVNAIIQAIRGVPVVGGTLANILTDLTGLRTTADVAKVTAITADLKADDNASAISDLGNRLRAMAVTQQWVSLSTQDMASFPRVLLGLGTSDRTGTYTVSGTTGSGGASGGSHTHSFNDGSHSHTMGSSMPTLSPGKSSVAYVPIVVDRYCRPRYLKLITGSSGWSLFTIDNWYVALCKYNPNTGKVVKIWDGGDQKSVIGTARRLFAFDMGTAMDNLVPGELLFAAQVQNAGLVVSTRPLAGLWQPGLTDPTADILVAPFYRYSGSSIPNEVDLSALTPDNDQLPWMGVGTIPAAA